MPDVDQGGIDVSAEEVRYLRRTFRRFALPYLLLAVALAGGALAVGLSSGGREGDLPSDELQSLVAESASLREAIAALREELHAQSSTTADRLASLEGGVAKLRRAASGGAVPKELAGRLDHAHQRINALEGRLQEMESRRAAAPAPASPAPTWPQPGPSPR